ncbi:hypothetical protein A1US_04064, partial [Escherichia coli KTE78]
MASVLSEDTVPASKLVILLVASVPCAALNAPAVAFHSRESSPRLSTASVRLVMFSVSQVGDV